MSLIPSPYDMLIKVVAIGMALFALIGLGAYWGTAIEHGKRVAEVAELKAEYQARIDVAEKAKEAAEARAAAAEKKGADQLVVANQNHLTEITNERTKTAAAVARARAGDDRLRFYAESANTGGGGAVPGAPGATGGGDGRTLIELPAAVAGDLRALVGEVDDTLVPQIHLLQDTVKAYLTVCGPVTLVPVGGGPSAALMVQPQNPQQSLEGSHPSTLGGHL